ncbi:MAG: hypothetical protein ACRDBM_07415 [Sporomusa sp.]
MAFKHGVFPKEKPTEILPPSQLADGVPVFIGTAPIQQVEGGLDNANKAIYCSNKSQAVAQGPKISAGDVTSTATGKIAAVNVQAAIEELESEKLPYDSKVNGIRVIRDAGQYSSNVTVTGTIKINIPNTLTANAMFRMRLEGYVYTAAKDGWTLNIEAYATELGTIWCTPKALLTPNSPTDTVRFGFDSQGRNGLFQPIKNSAGINRRLERRSSMFSLSKRQAIILLSVVVLVILAAWLGWQQYSQTEAKLRQATVLIEQQVSEVKSLQEQLKISQGNAEALQAAYEQEKNKPATTFYVQASTLPAAAEQVQDRINNND